MIVTKKTIAINVILFLSSVICSILMVYILINSNYIANSNMRLIDSLFLFGTMIILLGYINWTIWLFMANKNDAPPTLSSKRIKTMIRFIGVSTAVCCYVLLFFSYEILKLIL